MEINNLSEAKFETLVITMLKELTEYFNSIKKTQAEMKGKLIEIKKKLQGTKSGVDEPKIKSMIWSIREIQTFNQNKMKKQEFQKMRRVYEDSGMSPKGPTSESQGCQKEKRKSKKLKIYLKK